MKIWLTHRPFPFRPTLHFRFGCSLLIDIPWRGTGRRAAERGCPSVSSSMGAFHRSAPVVKCASAVSQQHCADSSMNITQLKSHPSLSVSGRPWSLGLSLTHSVGSALQADVTTCVKSGDPLHWIKHSQFGPCGFYLGALFRGRGNKK